jgi:DNA-binding SARP family transcriptional activator
VKAEPPAGQVTFGVLGPVAAWGADGAALDLKGPRHRAVLARLAVARGRVVPLSVLIEDLWEAPPAGAAGAIQTFVGALRRAIEPGRSARTGFRILVTLGPGYALRAGPDDLDALRFERLAAAAASAPAPRAVELSGESLALWRGPAYAEFADEPWTEAERARLTELRLALTERQAEARLALGQPAQAVPDLQAHVSGHPWREEAWRLLALALYRSGRQAEALDVIRRARSLLATELGLDPGPSLAALEAGILQHAAGLNAPAGDVLAVTAAAYQRTAPGFTRTRLESAATLAGGLALTGGSGLRAAMSQRLAAIEAAEQLGDPELTARVIGNYDVPAIWTRSDDEPTAARIVAAAERTLSALPAGRAALRARLLATIAVESRGDSGQRPGRAAAEAEAIARRLGDPALLAFTLNGTWMQSFSRTGLAPRRDAIGAEIVTLACEQGLVNFEILGRLIRLQALSGLGDFTGADAQSAALDQLAELHERPAVSVFTRWYRAMRTAAATTDTAAAEDGYRQAATLLDQSGMPGVASGLLPLALLCLRVWRHEPAVFPDDTAFPGDTDWGPYHAWAHPWLLLARDRAAEARQALERCPAPPPGLLTEALWSLTARAAVALDDPVRAAAARDALLPAAAEIAGAASAMLTAGPVSDYLTELRGVVRRSGLLREWGTSGSPRLAGRFGGGSARRGR